jgi:hypothetical protein
MLFSRYKWAHEKSRNIRQNMASVAELKKSSFAQIDKVENREDLVKLRVIAVRVAMTPGLPHPAPGS